MVATISGTQITYFAGGRIGIFRLWRRALLLKMSQAFDGNPVRLAGVTVERNPLFAEPVFYMTVTGEEIVPS